MVSSIFSVIRMGLLSNLHGLFLHCVSLLLYLHRSPLTSALQISPPVTQFCLCPLCCLPNYVQISPVVILLFKLSYLPSYLFCSHTSICPTLQPVFSAYVLFKLQTSFYSVVGYLECQYNMYSRLCVLLALIQQAASTIYLNTDYLELPGSD
jgi:hypothetical protein